jgi:hypothetical protein
LFDDALLVANELVANAVSHAGRADLLRLELGPRFLTIAVTDPDPAPPLLETPSPEAESGRGMFLIDQVGSAWGVIRAGTGKTTWCALRVTAAAPTRAGSHGREFASAGEDVLNLRAAPERGSNGHLETAVRRLDQARLRLAGVSTKPWETSRSTALAEVAECIDAAIRDIGSVRD